MGSKQAKQKNDTEELFRSVDKAMVSLVKAIRTMELLALLVSQLLDKDKELLQNCRGVTSELLMITQEKVNTAKTKAIKLVREALHKVSIKKESSRPPKFELDVYEDEVPAPQDGTTTGMSDMSEETSQRDSKKSSKPAGSEEILGATCHDWAPTSTRERNLGENRKKQEDPTVVQTQHVKQNHESIELEHNLRSLTTELKTKLENILSSLQKIQRKFPTALNEMSTLLQEGTNKATTFRKYEALTHAAVSTSTNDKEECLPSTFKGVSWYSLFEQDISEQIEVIQEVLLSLESCTDETLRQLDSSRSDSESKAFENLGLSRTIDDMKREMDDLNISLQREKRTIENMSSQLDLTQKKYDITMKELEDKTLQLNEKSLDLEKIRQENINLQEEIRNLKDEKETINKQLEKYQRNSICRVQLFSPCQNETMYAMEQELLPLIKGKLDVRMDNFELVQCKTIGEMNQSLPILLLCINVSRLGTDVAKTLKGLQPNPKMAVVVFHHKDAHALPSQSSDRVLVGKEFEALGGIFDLAFLSGKGLYKCSMNEENVSKLINFIIQLKPAQ